MTAPVRDASTGLIIRQKEPRNPEAPFEWTDSYLTPTRLFYIRSHFSAPDVDAAPYRLRVDGAVRRPFSLTYQELREMRSETRVAVPADEVYTIIGAAWADATGRVQPDTHDPHYGGYAIHHPLPIDVFVGDPA